MPWLPPPNLLPISLSSESPHLTPQHGSRQLRNTVIGHRVTCATPQLARLYSMLTTVPQLMKATDTATAAPFFIFSRTTPPYLALPNRMPNSQQGTCRRHYYALVLSSRYDDHSCTTRRHLALLLLLLPPPFHTPCPRPPPRHSLTALALVHRRGQTHTLLVTPSGFNAASAVLCSLCWW